MLLLYSSNQVEVYRCFIICVHARGRLSVPRGAQVSAGVEADGNIPAQKLDGFN